MTGGDTTESQVVGTALTDLSANIFAALFLLVLMLLASRAPGGAPDAASTASALRAPLSSAELVTMLRERAPQAPGLGLDVTRSGIRETGSGPAGAPVRLYVFSHDRYREALGRVAGGGEWREMTVPAALRDPSGDDWSPDFLRLARDAADADTFRRGLARLLAAAPERRLAGGAEGGGSAARPDADPLSARLARWASTALGAAALLFGFGAVLMIEKLARTREVG